MEFGNIGRLGALVLRFRKSKIKYVTYLYLQKLKIYIFDVQKNIINFFVCAVVFGTLKVKHGVIYGILKAEHGIIFEPFKGVEN